MFDHLNINEYVFSQYKKFTKQEKFEFLYSIMTPNNGEKITDIKSEYFKTESHNLYVIEEDNILLISSNKKSIVDTQVSGLVGEGFILKTADEEFVDYFKDEYHGYFLKHWRLFEVIKDTYVPMGIN